MIVVIFIEYEVRVVLHLDHQMPDVVKESGDDQLVTGTRGPWPVRRTASACSFWVTDSP